MVLSENTKRVLEALNRLASTTVRLPQHTDTFTWSVLYTAEAGRDRDRVVVQSQIHKVDETPDFSTAQRSVQCFVEHAEDGNILYAGSWKAPAKWKSGLATEFTAAESEEYAQFVHDGGWGYKDSRKAWEERTGR